MERTGRETLIDQLLTLFLIAETQKFGHRISGKVKLMKMIYQAEAKMIRDKVKAFNYSFYRWDFGPMSNDVMKDCKCLVDNGFLKKQGSYILISNKGRELLEDSSELLSKNSGILKYIDNIVKEFGPYPGKRLKVVTYDLPMVTKKKLVRDTEPSEQILTKIEIDEARKWFLIDDEWEETLSLFLDGEACEALEKGMKDLRAGRVRKYQSLRSKS